MRFYLAWAAAIGLALVLPVAIPYAIWPLRDEGPQVDPVAECGRRAKQDAVLGANPIQHVWALSSEVQSCSRDEQGVLTYTAKVIARGPYGIPFASARVTSSGVSWHDKDSGAAFGLAALLLGAAAASIPFVAGLLQRRLRSMQPAAV